MRKVADLPQPGTPVIQGEAAFAGELLHAPTESFQARGDVQRLGWHVGSERVPLQTVQREHLVIHASSPSSLGR
jgi:hypothetical protein